MGSLFGALGFVAALTPSMIPRTEVVQGALAGIGFAVGYAAGTGIIATARLLELQPAGAPIWKAIRKAVFGLAAGVSLCGLAELPGWQNSTRAAMLMAPLESFHTFYVALLAIAVAVAIIFLGRIFRRAAILITNALLVILPARAAFLLGLLLTSILFWSIGSGILVRGVVDGLDASYAQFDRFIPADSVSPRDEAKSGGPGSLVTWNSLGAKGRDFVMARPNRADIATLLGKEALEPLRVYVGINSAETPEARATRALEELIRTGAFRRTYLVIATPTGTGWVDPAGIAPLEYLSRGNVATVAVQYSYLPSWLSLLVEPERGAETARHVFRTIYAYWSNLPKTSRPRLYLFGLSLGALNSDLSVDVYDILADPYQAALWAGPPFPSRTWNAVVAARNEGTSVWKPDYSDGRMFRFVTQDSGQGASHAPWGPLRVIYLQYPSDPIVFFQTDGLFRRPDIMTAPKAPDISSDLVWVPVISFLQSVVDMVTAAGTPRGFGHVYAGEDYLDAWLALTEPVDASPVEVDLIREQLVRLGL